jgi:uncharacterized membrane protein
MVGKSKGGNKRRNMKRALKEPSSAAGIALIISALATFVAQSADSIVSTGGDLKMAVVPIVTAAMGLLAVIMPEGGGND